MTTVTATTTTPGQWDFLGEGWDPGEVGFYILNQIQGYTLAREDGKFLMSKRGLPPGEHVFTFIQDEHFVPCLFTVPDGEEFRGPESDVGA